MILFLENNACSLLFLMFSLFNILKPYKIILSDIFSTIIVSLIVETKIFLMQTIFQCLPVYLIAEYFVHRKQLAQTLCY